MCGFSARTVAALDALGASYAAVDILPDPRIRQELSRDLQLADDPPAVRQRRAGRRLRHHHRDVRDGRAGRHARHRAEGRRARGGPGGRGAGRPAPPDPQRPRLERSRRRGRGPRASRPATGTSNPHAGPSPRRRSPRRRDRRRAAKFASTRAGTVSFAVATEDGRIRGYNLTAQFRSASMLQGDAAGRRAAPRRPPRQLTARRGGAAEPDDHGVRQRRGRATLYETIGDPGLAAVGRAARMTTPRARRRRLRDPHHRRRPGAPVPAHRPARPQAPPHLRPRAARRHRRPAAVGDRARRQSPPLHDLLQGRVAQGHHPPGRATGARRPPGRARGPHQRRTDRRRTGRPPSPESPRERWRAESMHRSTHASPSSTICSSRSSAMRPRRSGRSTSTSAASCPPSTASTASSPSAASRPRGTRRSSPRCSSSREAVRARDPVPRRLPRLATARASDSAARTSACRSGSSPGTPLTVIA